MRDVRRYASERNHLSGSPRSVKVLNWIQSAFERSRLRTGSTYYSFLKFTPHQASLTVGGRRIGDVVPVSYSGTTRSRGRTAPLFDGGTGDFSTSEAAGKIVVVTLSYFGNAIALNLNAAIAAAHKAHASGLIAISQAPDDLPRFQDVNSRAGVLGVPVVLVGQKTGERILKAADAGERATLTLTAVAGTGCDSDVWGILPGRARHRYIIVGTPVSSWVPAAAERGGGVATLLGLMRHYASLPQHRRPETMIFVALSGHEIGYLGLPVFIKAHRSWFDHADAYVHLGASIGAATLVQEPDGAIKRTNAQDPNGYLYASENSLLLRGVNRSFGRLSLNLAKPSVQDVGEQAYAYHIGVPIVAYSGSNLYFHTSGDIPSVLAPTVLVRMAKAFEASIDYVAHQARGAVRRANAEAAKLGRSQQPNPTPSGTSGLRGSGGRNPRLVKGCPTP